MVGTKSPTPARARWTLPPISDEAAADLDRFAHEIRMPPLMARLLFNRGICDAASAALFLSPRFRDLHPPELLPQIDTAASRIATAVKAHEKITLYGDYDVDGITGTAMLWHTLKTAGAIVDFYIPHRVDEGYGVSTAAVENLIAAGTQLLVTVDCGCSAIAPIARARELGVDVVVSDHHEFGPELPPAHAIVHPRLHTFSPTAARGNAPAPRPAAPYPNPDLCGAGVAFKLAWAVAQKICGTPRVSTAFRELLVECSALVALGTIADVVPLRGENRILVKFGLAQIGRTRFDGLKALIEAAGYGNSGEPNPNRKIDCTAVGFSLAPRLNAAGRMGHAREAVELLTTASGERALEIARWLEAQNRERQATEKRMVEIAHRHVAARRENQSPENRDPVLLVADESFHAGVVGIVASRLVDHYHRPAFVLAIAGEECHGSARSIPRFALHLAIDHARDLVISGGGHAMAGGVRLLRSQLDAFRERLNRFAQSLLTAEDFSPTLHADATLAISDCDPNLAAMIESLAPFGSGNPRPRFIIQNARLAAPPRRVGATGNHLQLTISQPPHMHRCIAFRMGHREPELPSGSFVDLIVEPRQSTWQGRPRLELHVVDIVTRDPPDPPSA